MKRKSPSIAAPPLLWDGQTLHGTPQGRLAEVWVPARFFSFRLETLPDAPLPARKSAARLRADRAFAALGPVAVDALLHPPQNGSCRVLLIALPQAVLDALRAAAQAKNTVLRAVRVAELAGPVPAGGVVTVGGPGSMAQEAGLVLSDGGQITGITSLGSPQDGDFPARLKRERLRLCADENTPGGPAPDIQPDFLHPVLLAPEPFMERRGVRLGLLGAAAALLAVAGLAFLAFDEVRQRDNARADFENIRQDAGELADRRAVMKTLAPWFEARPDTVPCLHALASAMPRLGAADQLRLVRVRQARGETAVVEGVAGDRAQMLAFLGRLRQDPRVGEAEIRSFRSPSRESAEVFFELGLRTRAGAAAPASDPKPAAPQTPAPMKGAAHDPS